VQSAADAREDIADLQSDLAYLRRQVQGLHSKLQGELAILALRIEDNERRTMKRRKVARRWGIAVVAATCLWLGPGAISGLFSDSFLRQGCSLVGMVAAGGVTLGVLILHNQADEQDHRDRHHNWFRQIVRDDPGGP
jgi:hypothetical protein